MAVKIDYESLLDADASSLLAFEQEWAQVVQRERAERRMQREEKKERKRRRKRRRRRER